MQSEREQLVAVALRLYRSNGVAGSTLKKVAGAAGIPLGNLYQFKTWDELVHALDACGRESSALLARLSPDST